MDERSNQLSDEVIEKLNTLHLIPSVFTNEIFIQMLEQGSMFRVTFCEKNVDTDVLSPRASVLLSNNSLNQLGMILLSMASDIAKRAEESKEAE